MYREIEKFRSLGFLGIWRESLKIIFKSEIFLRLTLTLILPPSFAHLAHSEISLYFFPNVMPNVENNMVYTMNYDTTSYVAVVRAFLEKWATYVSIEVVFAGVYIIFPISSSIVVAHATTRKNVTFKKVISNIVPRVWRRLVVNLILINTFAGVLSFVFSFVNTVTILSPTYKDGDRAYIFLSWAISSLYIVGDNYLSMICQLVDVVSILEGSMGLKALKQSMELMKGKLVILLAINIASKLCLGIGPELYKIVGVEANRLNAGMFAKVGLAFTILLLHCFLVLLQHVLVVVFYLVCKSSRCESVRKPAISYDEVR